MKWRFEIQRWDEPSGRMALVGAMQKQINLRLRSPSTLSFSMNGMHWQANSIQCGETDAFVNVNGEDVLACRCTADMDNIGPTRHGVSFTFADYRAVLQRREVFPGDGVIGVFTKTQQAWIEDLISTVQGRTNGDYGIATGSQVMAPFDRQWTVQAGQFAGSIIQEMANTDPKFDWDFNNSLELLTWNKRGELKNVALMYGKNVGEFSRSRSIGNFANDTLSSGSQDTTAVRRSTVDVDTDLRGRWDASMPDPEISVQATLNDRADANVANASKDPSVFSVKLRKDTWRGPSHFTIGDTLAQVKLASGARVNEVIEGPRVLEIQINVLDNGGENIQLTLERP